MRSNHRRILIAEDEAAHVEAIRRAFETGGGHVEIRTAATLAGYREAAAGFEPEIALLDLNLPDGRSLEVLRTPPEAQPFPILIMTSYGNEQTAVEAMKSGALDYVVKSPEAFATMPRIVERALREWGLLQERRRVEEERRELERRLLHSQKLESLGVLAGGIAHDFNNLLTAILGNLDLALEDLSPVSGARPSINEAVLATKRAVDLTRQMLAYSGRGHFDVKPLNLSELVAENAHLLKAAISKKVTLNLQLGKDLPPISADAGQMQQVVMNLITNASEAVGEDTGIATLATGVRECDDAFLSESRLVKKPAAGRFVYLEVADTGCGMDQETEQRLFDPFFTTKFTGRGLGLSAILGIVQGHGGAIMVDTTVGRGSRVRVFLPVLAGSEDPAVHGCPEGAERPADRGGGLVLVVDDEETVLRFCRKALERLGFEVITASNGEEAVAVFRERQDTVGLVLLDLTMPIMDGVATFMELRGLRPGIPVVMCSGFEEREATERLKDQGLSGFVQKPYGIQELRRVIEATLDHRPQGDLGSPRVG